MFIEVCIESIHDHKRHDRREDYVHDVDDEIPGALISLAGGGAEVLGGDHVEEVDH